LGVADYSLPIYSPCSTQNPLPCHGKGHQESWIGYKLHLETIDGDFPVSAVLTSASVHDSQVAMCHLMFGLVALTATALFARLC
jgi:hypothetical protein